MKNINLQQANDLHKSVHQMEINLNSIMIYLQNIETEIDEEQKKYWQRCLNHNLQIFNSNYDSLIKKVSNIKGE